MINYLEQVEYDKKKRPSLHISKELYDYAKLKACLEELTIRKSGNNVLTTFGGVSMCEMETTEKYGVFDFSQFLIETLPIVSKTFAIESIELNLVRGIQEFKAYSTDIQIDNEVFKPVFTVFSSSNGYYPLIICVGLFRLVCSNGMIVPFNENQFNVKLKHYSKIIPFIVSDFRERLPCISDEVSGNIQLIRRLKGQPISFKETLYRLMNHKIDSEERKTMVANLKRFSINIIKSSSDALMTNNLTEFQLNSIHNPIGLLRGESPQFEDIILDKYHVYNLYTEVFNKRNTSVIAQENSRIIHILASNESTNL